MSNTTEGQIQAVAQPGMMPFIHLVQSAMDSKQSPESMQGVLEAVRTMMAMNAEQAFNAARHEFQSLVGIVPHNCTARIVSKAKGVSYEYTYADLPQIARHCAPHLAKCGLSYSFDEDAEKGVLSCTVAHVGGHKVTVHKRIVGAKTSDSSEDVGNVTTARRMALSMALGIITDGASDYRAEASVDTATVTEEQAANIEAALASAGGDRAKFLALFGVDRFIDLPASRYADAINKIEAKRRAAK